MAEKSNPIYAVRDRVFLAVHAPDKVPHYFAPERAKVIKLPVPPAVIESEANDWLNDSFVDLFSMVPPEHAALASKYQDEVDAIRNRNAEIIRRHTERREMLWRWHWADMMLAIGSETEGGVK